MEIADLVVINKYDSEYRKACERLKRTIESSISLTMPKHMHEDIDWIAPVELASAKDNFNIESIWKQAMEFKKCMGPERIA